MIITIFIIIGITLAVLALLFLDLYRREHAWRKFETSRCADKEKIIDQQDAFIWELIKKQEKMQDRLSTILCPMNNHIWIGGKCSKCGRAKDAPHE